MLYGIAWLENTQRLRKSQMGRFSADSQLSAVVQQTGSRSSSKPASERAHDTVQDLPFKDAGSVCPKLRRARHRLAGRLCEREP